MVDVLHKGSTINSHSPFAMYKILIALRNLASLRPVAREHNKAFEKSLGIYQVVDRFKQLRRISRLAQRLHKKN